MDEISRAHQESAAILDEAYRMDRKGFPWFAAGAFIITVAIIATFVVETLAWATIPGVAIGGICVMVAGYYDGKAYRLRKRAMKNISDAILREMGHPRE